MFRYKLDIKGQLAGWEALIIIVLLGACGGLFYLYSHKPSEAQIFQSGSKPNITQPHYQTSPFSCINLGAQEFMEAKHAQTNSITNSAKP